ncbi:hypothetical protein KQI77_03050 [Clostridium sp. MSJ-8]|uniref:hypothetical protein n=1 Tax=Clostridium sp. MSJ-8 TaxID=2841510 RepID=UPI001C0ED253|nr:hypothetical protein [Clostridium sp. MSJ-8]MBU5487141.1 hypothetical protein [Clostridium sp. MSJ-8]
MDPYKVLGVFPYSSSIEIKEAYEKILNDYNIKDIEEDDTKKLYLDKISEANEAYRIINLNITCQEVRDLIEKDDFVIAESKLNLVSDNSSAEWNYLKGILLIKKGWVDSGFSHIRKASTLNPYNQEYLDVLNKLNDNVKKYKNTAKTNMQNNNSTLCNNNKNNRNNLC